MSPLSSGRCARQPRRLQRHAAACTALLCNAACGYTLALSCVGHFGAIHSVVAHSEAMQLLLSVTASTRMHAPARTCTRVHRQACTPTGCGLALFVHAQAWQRCRHCPRQMHQEWGNQAPHSKGDGRTERCLHSCTKIDPFHTCKHLKLCSYTHTTASTRAHTHTNTPSSTFAAAHMPPPRD